MELQDYLSLGVSLVALLVSIVSLRRSNRFQDFDYSVKLQLANEEHTTLDNGFQYRADLQNVGAHPVQIIGVSIKCEGWTKGSSGQHAVSGGGEVLSWGTYLQPGASIPLQSEVTLDKLLERIDSIADDGVPVSTFQQNLDIMWDIWLIVSYTSPMNRSHSVKRLIALYKPGDKWTDGLTDVSHTSSMLT